MSVSLLTCYSCNNNKSIDCFDVEIDNGLISPELPLSFTADTSIFMGIGNDTICLLVGDDEDTYPIYGIEMNNIVNAQSFCDVQNESSNYVWQRSENNHLFVLTPITGSALVEPIPVVIKSLSLVEDNAPYAAIGDYLEFYGYSSSGNLLDLSNPFLRILVTERLENKGTEAEFGFEVVDNLSLSQNEYSNVYISTADILDPQVEKWFFTKENGIIGLELVSGDTVAVIN